jgi:predicted nucleotidyltransferase
MPPLQLPAPVEALAAELAGLPAAVAIVLGGSRATGTYRPDSDWDLGLYYRGSRQALNPDDVRNLGHVGYVSELGEWGRIVHGGGWLTVDGTPVDVLFRDLDVIERWIADAEEGRFEVVAQNGYVVGAPTYLPVGELAVCRPIAGELPRPAFPKRLAVTAGARWEGNARVALMFAQSYASAADAVACTGMLAHAVLCIAHARLARRREWALNEKRLVARAGLDGLQSLIGRSGTTREQLADTVDAVSSALGVEPLSAR